MLRLTLAQMRRSLTRLVAAAIAIAIGTAFLAATLLAGDVITRTGYDAVTARLGHADLVVSGPVDDAVLARLRAVPQVAAADPVAAIGVSLTADGQRRWVHLVSTPSDPRLASLQVVEGVAPTGSNDIALPERTAKVLHLAIGDTVQLDARTPDSAADDTEAMATVRVVGIVSDPAGAWSRIGDAGLAIPADATRWSGYDSLATLGGTAIVARAAGVSDDELRAAVEAATPDGTAVLTRDEAAQEDIGDTTGNGQVLVGLVLAFAAVALLVAALVIANTFQVLVAQRTRTLALLRCVGASKAQLRASVLLEAGVLGAGASLAGVVTGIGLAQAALVALRHAHLDVPLPPTIHVTAAVVLVPLVVGTLVTLAASLVPARAATRVAPVAALRPVEAPVASVRSGGVRLWAAVVLTVGGGVGLAGAVALANADSRLVTPALGLGVLSGAASFVGVLLGAVYWVPRTVGLVGTVLARTGVAGRLAAANTARNPRRTAATSTALIIGVTLVAMMATGAASARESTSRHLDAQFPVDMTVRAASEGVLTQALPRIAAIEGVADVEAVRSAPVAIGEMHLTVSAADGDRLHEVLRNDVADDLPDGVVLLPNRFSSAPTATVVPLDPDTLEAKAGTTGRTVDVRTTTLGGWNAIATRATLDSFAPGAAVTELWVRLSPHTDPTEVQDAIEASVPGNALDVASAAADRFRYSRVIDTLLAIVVGLLAVAVLIALVGVANTLSLSVLERRRESATLRAIGLTRGRLRWTLGIEGMLIAGVGALLGVALGLVYGWAGAAVVLSGTSSPVLALPWQRLALAVLVATAAGLLASVLPARSAVRTPPVAALAVE